MFLLSCSYGRLLNYQLWISLVETDTIAYSACNYETKYKTNINRHQKVHKEAATALSEEPSSRPHICSQCGKSCRSRYGLTLHEKSERDLNFRFTCSMCQKAYNMLSAYMGHPANVCNVKKTFCHSKTLKEHSWASSTYISQLPSST